MIFFSDLFDGLRMGSVYSLIALAFTLGFSVTGLFNFVNSELFVIAIYILILCLKLKINIFFSLLLAIIICAGFNILVLKYIYQPVSKQKRGYDLIISIALAFLIQNIFVLLFSDEPLSILNLIKGSFKFFSIEIEYTVLVSLFSSLSLIALIYLLINYTKLGKIFRAVTENSDAVLLLGIDVNKIVMIVFGTCALLTSVAGYLYAVSFPIVDPYVGMSVGLHAVIAAIIGGLDSVTGAVAGGFIIGVLEVFFKSYISSQTSDIFIFALLFIYLIANNKKFIKKRGEHA